MFGYIKPYKPQLRICEYESYKAVYCGLCRELAHTFGPFARWIVSYDFAFVTMLKLSLSDEPPVIGSARCPFNPLHKSPHLEHSEALQFSAAAAVLMLYYKGLDNLRDGGISSRLAARLYLPLLRRGRRKAAARYARLDQILADAMEAQKQVESRGERSLDAACHPTAQALGTLFGMLSEDASQKRVLTQMGYLIGRYVYICDAVDDIKRDRKSGDYNPFLAALGPLADDELGRMETELKSPALLSASEAGKACLLLDLDNFKPIIENIVCLGLAQGVKSLPVGGKALHE